MRYSGLIVKLGDQLTEDFRKRSFSGISASAADSQTPHRSHASQQLTQFSNGGRDLFHGSTAETEDEAWACFAQVAR